MAQHTLASRVDTLERKMGRLEELPDRMVALESQMVALESQIVQFRAEVRVEFSAVREELTRKMVALNGDTLTQVRILHEDAISRFALLDDHIRGRRRKKD